MLVLSRRQGQSLRVDVGDGKEIVITVVRIQPGAVRIGIEAPKEMNVARSELLEGEESTNQEDEK